MKSGIYCLQGPGGIMLAKRIRYCRGPWFRMKGLLGRKQLSPDEGIYLCPCNSIHMFFMKFPIDVLFVDQSMRILRIDDSIRPWSLTPLVKGAHAAFELSAGKARETGLSIGDQLTLLTEPANAS